MMALKPMSSSFLAAALVEVLFPALARFSMKRWIVGFVVLVAAVVICSNADAIVLQSATRSVHVKLAREDGYQEQYAESTEFGDFGAVFGLNGGLGGGWARASQGSDISPDRIVANAYADGHRGINSASALFSVTFSVVEHPQDVRCIVSYEYYSAGQVDLYDLTHSEWVFLNPRLWGPEIDDVILVGYGDYSREPVAFQLTLPEADYRLRANAIAVTSDPEYTGHVSIDFEPVPEPTTFVLLTIGAISLLAYVWRRRQQIRNFHP